VVAVAVAVVTIAVLAGWDARNVFRLAFVTALLASVGATRGVAMRLDGRFSERAAMKHPAPT
jgi:hypothetical protein